MSLPPACRGAARLAPIGCVTRLAVAGLLAAGLAACAAGGPGPAGVAPSQSQSSAAAPTPDSAGTSSRTGGTSASHAWERTLPNGMKVLVKRDDRAPTAVHMVMYRAGSMDEVNGRTGVAHVLEHMMFKGTKSLAPGEFSRRVAAMGGRENAFTSRDYTGYYQQIHVSRLEEVMRLESDRMANLVLSADEFAKEIRVVMEERRLRTEDRATGLLYEQLMATALIAHPYRHPIVGWMADLEAMTVADAQAWYDDWYSPSNAILVVAGAADPERVWAIAQRTYGPIPARAMPQRRPQDEPAQRGPRRIQVAAPAENPYVAMAFRVPRLTEVDGDREPYALEVLATLLDGGDATRLTREVVRGSRIANRAGAGYDMTQRGPALFVLDGTPAEGRTTADVERALRDQIARIAKEGVPQAELDRVKVQYVAGQVYRRDSVFAQAMELVGLEIVGLSHRDADRILEKIRSVTADEVKAVAAKHFGDDRLTVATLLPQPIGERRAAPAPTGLRH
jgi:zinc protease